MYPIEFSCTEDYIIVRKTPPHDWIARHQSDIERVGLEPRVMYT